METIYEIVLRVMADPLIDWPLRPNSLRTLTLYRVSKTLRWRAAVLWGLPFPFALKQLTFDLQDVS